MKQAMINSSQKKIVDLLVHKRFDKVKEEIGFSSNIFMVFGLPTQKLKNNPAYWTKKTSLCEVTITRDEKYELPYGCYARINQIFIDTEVRTKNTNVIDVGKTFNEYVKKVGYKEGYANKALLRQLINYVTSMIKVEPADPLPGRILGVHSLVAQAWDIFFDIKNPDQLTFSNGQIILEENYAKYIHKHAVPLDMNVVRCFKRNPLALDFYRFIAYRNNGLNKTVAFSDKLLFEQLGTEQQAEKVIRNRLKTILKTIQLYWPVKAKFEDEVFELQPSPPAVGHKLPSKSSLAIVNKAV
ncbi:MAG: replication protein RepA [Candidatus Omnitrophota bacterium]